MPEVDPQRKKSLGDLIKRMEKGFDENLLDPLVDSIVNEPDKPLPSENEVKAKEIKYKVIEVKPTGPGEDLGSFLGAKLGESFSMAAKARRADTGIAKPKMFYMGKALGNQFGGDLVNRTKGYLSANPDDTQDPALSRSQRFTASVQPFMGEQGPLPAPVQGPERTGVRGAFDKLAEQFDQLIALRKHKAEQSKVANQIQQVEVKEATEEITENNELKKKSTEIKKDFIAFNRDQESESEVSEIEEPAEERNPTAGLTEVDNSRGDDDDEEEEDDDGGGGGLLDFGLDLIDGGGYFGRRSASVGRRGAGRIVQRTALRIGGKKLAQTAAVKASQAFIKKAALGLMRPLIKRIPLVGGLIDFAVSLMLGEPLGRAAAKAVGATLGGALGTLIPVPFAGTILGGFLGDMVGGAIYDALTGGGGGGDPSPRAEADATKRKGLEEAPSTKDMSAGDREALVQGTRLPDAGGAGSINNVPDPLNDPLGLRPPTKLASGGIMAGEAGPEAVFSLSSTKGREVVEEASSVQNTSMSAMPFILGITQNVTSLIAGPAKPYIQQEIGTLERLFGIAKFNVTEVVGKGADAVKSVGKKVGINIPGTGGDAEGVESQESMTSNNPGPIAAVNVPAGDVKERAKVAFKFYKSKGFSDSGAAYMVGNLMQESTLNPAANGDNGRAWGLAQWRDDAASGGRWIKYKEWAAANNKEPGDFFAQLEYTIVEGAGYRIERMKGNDVQEHMAFVKDYEGYHEEGSRFGYAQDILNNVAEYKGGTTPSMTPPPSAEPAPESESSDEDGGHDSNNPGPVGETPDFIGPPNPAAAAEQNGGHTPEAPGPVFTAPPMPANLQAMEANDEYDIITIQPVIFEGSTDVVGYQKNTDMGSDVGITQHFFDKTGQKTTLKDLKAKRLQNN